MKALEEFCDDISKYHPEKGLILQLVCVVLCTDLGFGLVVQPLYISVIAEIL